MNNQRRKVLNTVETTISDLINDLNEVMEDEQEAFDNMPESIQTGDRGDAAQDAIIFIEDAIGNLEQVESILQDAAQ